MTLRLVETDPHEQIERLEAQIEELAEARKRCRKMMLAARASIVLGAVWIGILIIGPFKLSAFAVVAATIAIIGGIVVYGSNLSTDKQLEDSLQAAESQRAELIGQMQLRIVPDAGQD